MMICCSNCYSNVLIDKKYLYSKTKNIVNEFLDITFLIQKLEEAEKLKFVILSTNQLALFKFISKDFCSLNKEKIESNYIHKYKNLFNSEKQMLQVAIQYKNLLLSNRRIKSNVDEKLVELLSEEIKSNN